MTPELIGAIVRARGLLRSAKLDFGSINHAVDPVCQHLPQRLVISVQAGYAMLPPVMAR